MNALAGLHILVTRPAGQEKDLLALLRSHGARVTHKPTIAIIDHAATADNLEKARALDAYQLLIFISRNAVDYGMALLREAGIGPEQAPHAAAVGRGTAERLMRSGFRVVVYPPTPGSEALLEQDALKSLPPGGRVLIFRGRGGKEELTRTLRKRRCVVDHAEVYERVRPANESLDLLHSPPDLIMATSRDGLENLVVMTTPGSRRRLLETTLLLGSKNMLPTYEALGFSARAIVAASPLDEDMAAAALSYADMAGPGPE